jgi:drug/metabolite transporter (DMT)-like permease
MVLGTLNTVRSSPSCSSRLVDQDLLGYGYLALIGAALAYTLWFRGIAA